MTASSILKVVDAAIAHAKDNETKFRMACILLDDKGSLMEVAHNNPLKTHPWQSKLAEKVGMPQKQYLHAEIAALVRARKEPHTVVVARVLQDDTPALARPCPVCMEAIRASGASVIVYTGNDGQILMERV